MVISVVEYFFISSRAYERITCHNQKRSLIKCIYIYNVCLSFILAHVYRFHFLLKNAYHFGVFICSFTGLYSFID
jgi:hypothetical protein